MQRFKSKPRFYILTVITVCIIILFNGCKENSTTQNSKCVSSVADFDSLTVKPLHCGLYKDGKGVIGFKTMRYYESAKELKTIYLTTVYADTADDAPNEGFRDLRAVIDTATFQFLGMFYMQDKNHIYSYAPMSDGGIFAVNFLADPQSFSLLESECYGKDAHHCFHRGSVIEGADVKTFHVLSPDYDCDIAYDCNHYYEGTDILSDKEVKAQKLDSIRLSAKRR